jgi:hypothetical protein
LCWLLRKASLGNVALYLQRIRGPSRRPSNVCRRYLPSSSRPRHLAGRFRNPQVRIPVCSKLPCKRSACPHRCLLRFARQLARCNPDSPKRGCCSLVAPKTPSEAWQEIKELWPAENSNLNGDPKTSFCSLTTPQHKRKRKTQGIHEGDKPETATQTRDKQKHTTKLGASNGNDFRFTGSILRASESQEIPREPQARR